MLTVINETAAPVLVWNAATMQGCLYDNVNTAHFPTTRGFTDYKTYTTVNKALSAADTRGVTVLNRSEYEEQS